jgi:glycosyltransferase involved in cell wall biosynthesis
MKILIESYSTVFQQEAGGVQTRIRLFIDHLKNAGIGVKKYDKWSDKLDEYDILHIFKIQPENYSLFRMAQSKGIPVIISTVIPIENRFKIILAIILYRLFNVSTGYSIIYNMLRNAEAILPQTVYEADFLKKYYRIKSKTVHIIPNGVNITHYEKNRSLFSQSTGIKGKYVLQVGRFDENKNQISVIQAMSNTNIPIVFIGGEDPAQPSYYQRCKDIAGRNIHFLGWINHNDPLLSSAYMSAQIVILPSHKEIFGNSLIEGGAAGANLIATKSLPINAWGLSKLCLSIDPNDTDDIKKKIETLFNKPLDPAISEIIKNRFSWERVIDTHLQVYSIVNNRLNIGPDEN